MDTWIVLANDTVGDRHRRGLYVLKSRGMAHSNELCEFVMTNRGLSLRDPNAAPHGADAAEDGSRKVEHHAAV
jgi:circadian clock protein KaiC